MIGSTSTPCPHNGKANRPNHGGDCQPKPDRTADARVEQDGRQNEHYPAYDDLPIHAPKLRGTERTVKASVS
jgi:hypothetical protein